MVYNTDKKKDLGGVLANEKIVEYIENCRAIGMVDEKIQENLKAAGWGSDQIAEAFSLKSVEPQAADIAQEPIQFEVTDNKIPHRDMWWYTIFAIIFVVGSTVVIYKHDWVLLFCIAVFSGVILWRGHEGVDITLQIDNEGLSLNKRKFSFDQIDHYYFSIFGDDITITFQMTKKHYPRMTFILANENDIHLIRQRMEIAEVPESEPRDEGYVDLMIRKLKL